MNNATTGSNTETLRRNEALPGEREITKGVDYVKDVASTVAHSVSDAASNVAHNVSDAASYVRQKADNATSAVGGALEDTGHYLRNDGIQSIATDLTNFVRRNPIPASLAGITIGFLIARATQRGSDSFSRRGGIDG